jgi:hypothetical protein
MQELNLPFLCDLGAKLDGLIKQRTDGKIIDMWWAVLWLQQPLSSVLSELPLSVCAEKGNELIQALNDWSAAAAEWSEVSDADPAEAERRLGGLRSRFSDILTTATEFRTVLFAEMATLRAYVVLQKGIYATSGLVETAERTLPEPVIYGLPEAAIYELREGGKCLAFECATAAGFHVLRATELVLHEYYLACCKPRSKRKLENWGAYLAQLRQCNNATVSQLVALLQQIKDLERNLIMHPERVLDPDEALCLFELAKSAIILMAEPPKIKRSRKIAAGQSP